MATCARPAGCWSSTAPTRAPWCADCSAPPALPRSRRGATSRATSAPREAGVTEDFSRYSRQVVLREVGVNGQQLLRDSCALVIGLGGLGSAASLYLAGAGLGRLLIADRDPVEPANLQRQILYRADDVGRPKTEAARERLAALNAEVQIEVFEGRLEPSRLAQMVAGAD